MAYTYNYIIEFDYYSTFLKVYKEHAVQCIIIMTIMNNDNDNVDDLNENVLI